jgi:hypothetical protein
VAGMTVWPNPAVSGVTVQLADPSDVGGLLEVFDQMGRRVKVVRITAMVVALDVSGWSPGMYFIRVSGGRGVVAGKLLKV